MPAGIPSAAARPPLRPWQAAHPLAGRAEPGAQLLAVEREVASYLVPSPGIR